VCDFFSGWEDIFEVLESSLETEKEAQRLSATLPYLFEKLIFKKD